MLNCEHDYISHVNYIREMIPFNNINILYEANASIAMATHHRSRG